MKVYVMLNHDRHHDPDVRVYADKSPAIADARSYMLDRLERLGLTPDIIADDEDEEEGFWEVYGGDGSEVVYYCNYSNEGDDYAMVIETELIGT